MRKRSRRQKHVPVRTCVGCREVLSKQEMMRIVRTPDGVRVDPTGKLPGRGAYLHRRQSCWRDAIDRGLLARALKVELTQADREMLSGYMESMADS